MNYLALREKYACQLKEIGRSNGKNEARWLIETAAGFSFNLIQEQEAEVSAIEFCEKAFAEIAAGVPFQYAVGVQNFFGYDFLVDRRVLIPRPETEVLVERVLSELKGKHNPSVLDICTGSGAIICAIAKEKGLGQYFAADVSLDALAVAKKNAENLGVKVIFFQGDLYEALPKDFGKCNVITANPPYLDDNDMASLAEGLEFEPSLALYGGGDGFDLCRKLMKGAPSLLNEGGLFIMEIGEVQGELALDYSRECNFATVGILKDLVGKNRFFVGTV